MTKRLPATAAPAPLEKYADQFDDLLSARGVPALSGEPVAPHRLCKHYA